MPVLRSLLFVPGNRANMLQKATGSNPDAFVPDLEDSVPADEKTEARNVTAAHLVKLAQAGARVIPRVNSLDTGLLEEDLAAVVGAHVYGVSVGKISTPADVAAVEGVLETLEARAGLQRGHVRLVPWIETALAIVKAYDICTASPRIVGVAFGAEDLTHDMAIERREDDAEVGYARNVMCVAARAAGVLALDTPYFGFRDPEGLQQNAQASRAIGFKGKFAIHPAQVDLINAAFSPSDAEVAHARRVVAAFEEAERQGRGSTSLDGRVVDVPVVKRARDLLDVAQSLE